jgi:hypothetical protein
MPPERSLGGKIRTWLGGPIKMQPTPGGHPDRILGLLERLDALQKEFDNLRPDDTVNAARLQSKIEKTQRFLNSEESIHVGNYNTGIKSPADGIMVFAAIVAVPSSLIFIRSYYARMRHRYRPYTPVKLERLAYAYSWSPYDVQRMTSGASVLTPADHIGFAATVVGVPVYIGYLWARLSGGPTPLGGPRKPPKPPK